MNIFFKSYTENKEIDLSPHIVIQLSRKCTSLSEKLIPLFLQWCPIKTAIFSSFFILYFLFYVA